MEMTTHRGADLVALGIVSTYKMLVTYINAIKDGFAVNPRGPEHCKTVDELEQYARSIAQTEPGFSSDLLGAIARHRN